MIVNVYLNDADIRDFAEGKPRLRGHQKRSRAMKKAEDNVCALTARAAQGRPASSCMREPQPPSASPIVALPPPVALTQARSYAALSTESSRASRPGLLAAPVKTQDHARPCLCAPGAGPAGAAKALPFQRSRPDSPPDAA